MNKALLAFVLLCLLTIACALTTTLTTPGDYVEAFGGDISVYVRILEMTDCTELQREFEEADELVKKLEPGTLAYREVVGYRMAAENRMKEVECAGDL